MCIRDRTKCYKAINRVLNMSRGREDGGSWLVDARKQFSLINKVDGNRDLRSGKIYENPASEKSVVRRTARRLEEGRALGQIGHGNSARLAPRQIMLSSARSSRTAMAAESWCHTLSSERGRQPLLSLIHI